MVLTKTQLKAIENSLIYSIMYAKSQKQEDELTNILLIIKEERLKKKEDPKDRFNTKL